MSRKLRSQNREPREVNHEQVSNSGNSGGAWKGSGLACLVFIFMALFAMFALAPSIIWTSDSDWSTGTFTNTTNITGDLMLNNTIIN